jgi:hypothetical protein
MDRNGPQYAKVLEWARNRKTPHRKYVKPVCEKCGFIALDKCQIDIHHIDRNHKNNHVENLMSLCANCHRLEHKGEKFT